MRFLTIKLFRDIKNNWSQFFSVFLMAFLCVLVFMGLQGAWGGLAKSLDTFIGKNNLADGWVITTGLTNDSVKEIKDISGITDVTTKFRISVKDQAQKNSSLSLDSYSAENISKFSIAAGKGLKKGNTNQILLNKEYAEANHYKVGDALTVENDLGKRTKLVICGLVQSPERIYYTGTQEFIAPNYKKYGYGFVSEEAMKQGLSYRSVPNVLEFKGKAKDYRKDFEEVLEESYVSYFSQDTLNDVANALERVGQIKNLSYLFSFLFILLAILAMYTTIRRLIETQTKEIAVLKALGFSNTQVGLHYASFGLIIGSFGALLGAAAAPLISWFVLSTQKEMFSIPKWYVSYNYSAILIVGLVIMISTISAYSASRQARAALPAEFLSGGNAKKVHHILLEKIPGWNKINFGNRWALRDVTLNRIRFLMGIVGVAGGMMLLIAGFGMPESINTLVNKAYTEDFTYDRRIYTPDYQALKEQTDIGQWIQFSTAHFQPDDGYNRLLMVISDGEFVNMQTEDKQAIKADGIYITKGFAQRANIKAGDRLSVQPSLDRKKYTFTVAGIIDSETSQGAYIKQSLWEQSGGTFAPTTLLVNKQSKPSSIAGLNTITEVIKIADQKKNAYEFVASLMSIFMMIIGFAILLVVVILYNLGSLNFVERMRDFATLRVLGFKKNQLRKITMYENVLTTFIGWLIGIPLGFWFLDQYVKTFSTIHLEYTSHVGLLNLILASLVVWICSLSTTFFVGRRIKKIDMVSALKGVE
jgi:putative ABC transport system permease protein